MPVLVFPENPVNGQIYPPISVPGVQQYVWNSATTTWEIYETAFIEKSFIEDKGDLIVGKSPGEPDILPVGLDGQVLIADSGEDLGIKWGSPSESGIPQSIIEAKGDIIVGQTSNAASILPKGSAGQVLTVDQNPSSALGVKWSSLAPSIPPSIIGGKGDLIVGESSSLPSILPAGSNSYVLTSDDAQPLGLKWSPPPSSGPQVSTVSFLTSPVSPGGYQDFSLSVNNFFTLLSVAVSASSSIEELWLRMYVSATGRLLDTRVQPGPPFPSVSTGFALELVSTNLDPIITLTPSLPFYSEEGNFFRVVNRSNLTQSFNLTFKVST